MAKRRSSIKIETKESRALKRMRKATGLSIIAAAKASGLNVNVSKINHCESGRANPDPQFIEDFLKAFNFTKKDWEIFWEGEKPKIGRVSQNA
jgi:transcriptional regulator with XRE-family HTH domain